MRIIKIFEVKRNQFAKMSMDNYQQRYDGLKMTNYRSPAPEASVVTNTVDPTAYEHMPMHLYGKDIAKVVLQYQQESLKDQKKVFGVVFPTGSGKTIYLPKLFAEMGQRIKVSIPTTVGVLNAYNYNHKNSGQSVGYAAGRVIRYDNSQSIVYATTGHFTEKIIYMMTGKTLAESREVVSQYIGDIFMVDEVHTGSKDTALLMGLLSYLYPPGSPNFRDGPIIIVSTATLENDIINTFYPNFVEQITLNVPMSTPYKITNVFLQGPSGATRDPLDSRKQAGFDSLHELLKTIVLQEITNSKRSKDAQGRKFPYHGIIFRPGAYEVEETVSFLQDLLQQKKITGVKVYPMYSSMPEAELLQARKDTTSHIKIVVGTNLIESSITINNVGFIINDYLEKITGTTGLGQRGLQLSVITKPSALQRAGRTGRTRDGTVYHLITEGQYQYQIKETRPSEIKRVSIHDIILKIMKANLHPIAILKASNLPVESYRVQIKELMDLGMVYAKKGERQETPEGLKKSVYQVSTVGQLVARFPLDINNGYLVTVATVQYKIIAKEQPAYETWLYFRLRVVMAVAAMLQNSEYSFFTSVRLAPWERNNPPPEKVEEQNRLNKLQARFYGHTDIHTLAKIFIFYTIEQTVIQTEERKAASTKDTGRQITFWSEKNGINAKSMRNSMNLLKDIERIVAVEISARSPFPDIQQWYQFADRNFAPSHEDREIQFFGDYVAEMFSLAYSNQLFQQIHPDTNNYSNRHQNIGPVALDKNSDVVRAINEAKKTTTDYTAKETRYPTHVIGAFVTENNASTGRTFRYLSKVVTADYFAEDLRQILSGSLKRDEIAYLSSASYVRKDAPHPLSVPDVTDAPILGPPAYS